MTDATGNSPAPPVAAENPPDQTESESKLREKLFRLIPMIGCGIVSFFLLEVLFFMTAMQFVVVLVTDDANETLKMFSAKLIVYLGTLLDYMLYRRDHLPFPFEAFPETPNDGPAA